MTKRQEALLARLEAWFNEAGHARIDDAANALYLPREAAQAVGAIGISEGSLVMLGDEICTRTWLADLHSKLLKSLGEEPFPPATLRSELGLSRLATDHLATALEQLDWLVREPGGWHLQKRAEG